MKNEIPKEGDIIDGHVGGPQMSKFLRSKRERLELVHRISHRTKEGASYTYGQLLADLQNLTPEQRNQAVHMLPPALGPVGKPVLLNVGIALDTVENLVHVDGDVVTPTRSGDDFAHHPEQVVIVMENAPYDEEGNTSFLMTDEGFVGDKTGKVYSFATRQPGEPSYKTSQSEHFRRKMDTDTAVLEVRMAKLAGIDVLTEEEGIELNNIQAELYRRIYRIPPRKNEGAEWIFHGDLHCANCKADLKQPNSIIRDNDEMYQVDDWGYVWNQEDFLVLGVPDAPELKCVGCGSKVKVWSSGYSSGLVDEKTL